MTDSNHLRPPTSNSAATLEYWRGRSAGRIELYTEGLPRGRWRSIGSVRLGLGFGSQGSKLVCGREARHRIRQVHVVGYDFVVPGRGDSKQPEGRIDVSKGYGVVAIRCRDSGKVHGVAMFYIGGEWPCPTSRIRAAAEETSQSADWKVVRDPHHNKVIGRPAFGNRAHCR